MLKTCSKSRAEAGEVAPALHWENLVEILLGFALHLEGCYIHGYFLVSEQNHKKGVRRIGVRGQSGVRRIGIRVRCGSPAPLAFYRLTQTLYL